jgi:predicted RNA-binding Zn ribbon-like protein
VDLPERLDLPLASGEPWWFWLGGRPAMDFVNTLRERWRREVETLVTSDDLSAWLVRAGVMGTAAPVPGDVLVQARELREAIDACVVAAGAGQPMPASALTTIDDWLVFAGARPQVRVEDGIAVLGERLAADSPRRALGMIALDAAQMLGTGERDRIRICASDTCSARFYDRSPGGARRWCSMKGCGNVAKARRHRARTKAWADAPAGEPPSASGARRGGGLS